MEELLTVGSITSRPSLPFQAWCRLQAEHAAKHLDPESSFTGSIPPPNLEYWGLAGRSNLVQGAVEKEFILSEETTRSLLGLANSAYETQPVELFQAALLHSFMLTFKDRPQPPAIFSESHGREVWDPSINIVNTVGWFTTISGTYIDSHNVLDILRQTKDRRRSLRDNGFAYFSSRYLNPKGRTVFQCDGPLEVIFNFTGLYQQLERSDALFSTVSDFEHGVLDVADGSPRFAIFDVIATPICNQLRLSFFYNRHAAETRPVDQWISNYEQSLCGLARTLPSLARSYSLVDFPLIPFTYPMLDRFVSETLPESGLSVSDIEDGYPCSAIQNGMLLILPPVTNPVQTLESEVSSMPAKGSPPYHLTLCGSAAGELFCLLEINHALLDGTSLQILVRDMHRAYDNSLPTSPGLLYSNYIKYVQSLPVEVSKDYWQQYLAGSDACLFPTSHVENTPRQFQAAYAQLHSGAKLPWALVLRAYTGSDDVCFGYLTTGREIPLAGIEDALGPFINMLVCRTQFPDDIPLAQLLQRTQHDYLQSTKHQHLSLAETKRSLNLPDLPLFNTIVSFQRSGMTVGTTEAASIQIEPIKGEDPTEYDITLNVWIVDDTIEIALHYWTTSITESQATIALDTLTQAVSEITSKISQPVGDLDLFGSRSRDRVFEWNEHVPPGIDCCAHELIKERNSKRPNAPAIHAWDGQLTYGELDSKADDLATHLAQNCSVGPGVFVPVYFEKSKWTTVAILAVLKAGGAFVLMDPSHPVQRLRGICQDVKASVVITSETNASIATQFGIRVVIIGDNRYGWETDPELPAEANRIGLFLDSNSRVLQFASYAFDISIADMLLTLLAGGCVCVPSDEQRQSDLIAAVNDLQANWACLTPSVTRIIDPETVSCIKTLVLCGEAIAPGEITKWKPAVHLLNLYGPAECAILTTLNRHVENEKDPNNVGLPTSAVCWIADPDDYEKLVPVGTVGELLVESPIVGREYVGEPAKTAASFLGYPAWLKNLRPGATGRLYRTGDLVQYLDDGSMRYIGRRDDQVKLRGQRVELGEVEYHLQQRFPNAKNVVAEVIRFPEDDRQSALMAFIDLKTKTKSHQDDSNIFAIPDDAFMDAVMATKSQLDGLLPVFMVPTIFCPLARLPLTKTGKTDRRAVRLAAASLTREQIGIFVSMSELKSPPVDEAERHFQRLFAEIFGLHVDKIGREDNWFRLGGDSILAMTLIPRAREAGYSIKMADVFNHPKLASLAAASVRTTHFTQSTIPPFALMSDQAGKEDLVKLAAAQCGIPTSSIEDVYPTTPLQGGLIALAAKRPGHYIATFEYELAEELDMDRFVAAWNMTAAANAILRTRIIQSDLFGFLQVVVRDPVSWRTFDDEQAYEAHIEALRMGLGDHLVHFGLTQHREGTQKGLKFFLTLHHALYDGGSLPRLWSQVQSVYNGQSLSPQPFNRFIEYVLTAEGADAFWKSEFEGLNAAIFPALPSARYIPDPSSSLTHTISAIEHLSADYTVSTAIQLAWAIVMSCYTDSEDILYGLTVNGRSAPVDGIEDITGPTFATFPMRAQVRQGHTVQEALASVQEKTVARMPFQHFGMQNIRQLSLDAETACNFQCHMAIQAPTSIADNHLLRDARTKHEDYGAFANYAFVLVCHLPSTGDSDIIVSVNYDKNIVEPLEATRMIRQFEHILRQIELSQSKPESKSIQLRHLDLLTPEDRQQLAAWNSTVPPSDDSCLHELVLRHADQRPDAPAISAWDGEMTFRGLDSASAILAQQLQSLGVQPKSLVPLLFDRSKWVVVAMTAVHRIGAACVNIDPGHPKGRIQDIVNRTGAKFTLISPSYRESMALEGTTLVTVPIEGQKPRAEALSAAPVSPRDVAFVIFTSGSTGQPKGILMEHGNLTSSIRGFSPVSHFDQNTRGLHFSSYAFDGSIYEIFGVLVNGGCICIPSEADRMNDVAPFIKKHDVNWALFTPSYVALLEPDNLPSVRTIMLGGEAVTQENVTTWAAKVNLVNGYGPAEATVCAVGLLSHSGWKQGTIGHVTGGVGWVTMPSDRSRLAPIGAPGELVIEGAVVTRGYLGDTEKTAAAYLRNPAWLRPFRKGHPESRVYFSGDIVQYNTDGTIRYLRRADNQVKLRGQRIELGEVEHHVRNAFPNVSDVVAEVVKPNGSSPILIAFVAVGGATDKLFHAPNGEFLAQAGAATHKISSAVPRYMVPSVFIPLPEVPRSTSGKANRRLLREEAAKLSQDDIQAFSGSQAAKRRPKTQQEKTLLSLWAQTFKIPEDDVGVDDNFLNLGDSIAAIRLSGVARRQGLHLPVAQIFQYPILSEQARVMAALESTALAGEYRPGLLLGISNIHAFFDKYLAADVHSYKAHDVEDILPATELQTSLLRGKNVTYSRLHMGTEVDQLRLEAACDALIRKHAILRTVFVPYRGEILQVVLRDPAFYMKLVQCNEDVWEFSEKLCSQDASSPVPFGSLHFQPVLISRSNSDHMFVIRMTHAQYDGGSFPIISNDLTSAYNGNHLQSDAPSFAHFLRYRLNQNSSEVHKFWREYLGGSQMTNIEMLGLTPQNDTHAEFVVKPFRKIPLPTSPGGITMASLVKAAWSIVLARAAKRKDVVFGHTINGRDAPLADVDCISGPCITISPFRVSMQEGWTILDLLNHTQSQHTRSMPYSSIDFKSILTKATPWSPDTDFGSVLTHQDSNIELGGWVDDAATSKWETLDLGIPSGFHVVTYPASDKLWVQFAVSSHKMHPNNAEYLMDQFCSLMAQSSEDASQPLPLELDERSDA
ncbi:hypothetical protein DL768_004545 [Monosporascus sp. mg162]|nr:hypothetical protein DL768_004545 [Monosporascus sp. mg162]